MKILFVEDHPTFGEGMTEVFRAQGAEVVWCRTQQSAIESLKSDFYDLLILDLSIPIADENGEVARENGQTVFHEALGLYPGIPIFILTGSDMDSFTKSLVRHGERLDLWGSKAETNTLDYFEKEAADRLLGEVARINDEVRKVEDIGINLRGKDLGLSAGARRVLKVATRRLGATSVDVVPLSGGLSSARVIRAIMRNAQGHVVMGTAAKLGTKAEIDTEAKAFHKDAKRLPMGFFPPVAEIVEKGTCGYAGIFYTLAEDYSQNLFDLLGRDVAQATAVVGSLKAGMGIWINASTMVKGSIADVRRRLVWDETFDELKAAFDLDVDDVEAKRLDYRDACVHGDLHGANVLISPQNAPILIDFGDVGPGASCLDPVTIELSIIFHPDGVRLGLSAALIDRLPDWPAREKYEAGHPFASFANACREWAYDVAGGDLAVLAAAYAYLLRQLRFDTVDRAKTLAALKSVVTAIREYKA